MDGGHLLRQLTQQGLHGGTVNDDTVWGEVVDELVKRSIIVYPSLRIRHGVHVPAESRHEYVLQKF